MSHSAKSNKFISNLTDVEIENISSVDKSLLKYYVLLFIVLLFCMLPMKGAYPQSVSIFEGRHHKLVQIDNEKYVVREADKQKSQEITQKIVKDLTARKGSLNIGSCERAVDISSGGAGEDSSYGIDCQSNFSKEKYYLLCNDEMFGHLSISDPMEHRPEVNDIIIFTAKNCFGG